MTGSSTREAMAGASASKPINLTASTVKLTTPQPARHPSPVTKATSLAYIMFERPDLDRTEQFLTDFGLRKVSRDDTMLFMRGTGPAPYCYIVSSGRKPRFIGIGFTVASPGDLTNLSKLPGASNIEDVSWPGGGQRVRLTDPAGFRVDAIYGQTSVEVVPHRAPIHYNSPEQIIRVNSGQRPPASPPQIIKLGHVLLEVANYQAVSAWYTQNFGFIPSDICVLPDGSPGATFFRLDLGSRPADHHTLALAQSFMASFGHCAFEVVDPDAVGVGQRVLQKRGWRHAWGIGRHILGSQIFDYWQDPWEDKHEHYCDGDVFTSEVPAEVHPLAPEAMAQWGPLMPKSFTKPNLGMGALVTLVRNLYGTEDLTIKKLRTLMKLFA